MVANFATQAREAGLQPWGTIATVLAIVDGLGAVAALLGVFPA